MTDAGTGPAVLGGTDQAVGTLPDDALTACTSCPHVAGGHDATSQRWCAATTATDGHALNRRCICPAGAVAAPVDGDLPARASGGNGADPGRVLGRLR
jgi:hypothetical protein